MRRDAVKERIAWQLEAERKAIFTLNEEDLYSYKANFVSACRNVLPPSPFSNAGPTIDADDPAVGIMGGVRGYFHGS